MSRKDTYHEIVKRALLKRNEPDRAIFLAVREQVYNTFFQLPGIQAVTKSNRATLGTVRGA